MISNAREEIAYEFLLNNYVNTSNNQIINELSNRGMPSIAYPWKYHTNLTSSYMLAQVIHDK